MGGYEEITLNDGDMNMFEVLQTLRSTGYDGGLQIDHLPHYHADNSFQGMASAYAVGYVAVSPHPFAAVTDGQGTFRLANVPPGHHVLTAWHGRREEALASLGTIRSGKRMLASWKHGRTLASDFDVKR